MNVLKFVCDIIKHEMNLADDQIWIYNQKIMIPSDNRIYVSVLLDDEHIFGVKNEQDSSGNGLRQITHMNVLTSVSIEMYSYGTKALLNRYNLIAALSSNYSIQKQEENSCQIGRMPIVFSDMSFAMPTTMMYGFHYVYNITHLENNDYKDIDYYSHFGGKVSFDDLNNTKDF